MASHVPLFVKSAVVIAGRWPLGDDLSVYFCSGPSEPATRCTGRIMDSFAKKDDEQRSPEHSTPTSANRIFDSIAALLRNRKSVSLLVKASVALLLWRFFRGRDKLNFLLRHRWVTLSGVLVTVSGYYMVKRHIPSLQRKMFSTATAWGMKAFAFIVKKVMAALLNSQSKSKPQNCAADLRALSETQFLPMLHHVNGCVDQHVGSLQQSLVKLQQDKKSLTPSEVGARIRLVFEQALCSHAVKSLAFAYLYSLEQIMLHVRQSRLHTCLRLTDFTVFTVFTVFTQVLIRSGLFLELSMSRYLEICNQAVVSDIFLQIWIPHLAEAAKAAVKTECQQRLTEAAAVDTSISRSTLKDLLTGIRHKTIRSIASKHVQSRSNASPFAGIFHEIASIGNAVLPILPQNFAERIRSSAAAFATAISPTANGLDTDQRPANSLSALVALGDPTSAVERACAVVSTSSATPTAANTAKDENEQKVEDNSTEADQVKGTDSAKNSKMIRLQEDVTSALNRVWDIALSSLGLDVFDKVDRKTSTEVDSTLLQYLFPPEQDTDKKLIKVVVKILLWKQGNMMSTDRKDNQYFRSLESTIQPEVLQILQRVNFYNGSTNTGSASQQQKR